MLLLNNLFIFVETVFKRRTSCSRSNQETFVPSAVLKEMLLISACRITLPPPGGVFQIWVCVYARVSAHAIYDTPSTAVTDNSLNFHITHAINGGTLRDNKLRLFTDRMRQKCFRRVPTFGLIATVLQLKN